MCLSYLNSSCKKNFMLNVFALNDTFKHTIYLPEISFAHSLFTENTDINREITMCRANASSSPCGNRTERMALSVPHSQCHGSHLICHWKTFSVSTKLSSCSSTANSKLEYLRAPKQRRNVPRPTETVRTGETRELYYLRGGNQTGLKL